MEPTPVAVTPAASHQSRHLPSRLILDVRQKESEFCPLGAESGELIKFELLSFIKWVNTKNTLIE
jgi:hypothetical protein